MATVKWEVVEAVLVVNQGHDSSGCGGDSGASGGDRVLLVATVIVEAVEEVVAVECMVGRMVSGGVVVVLEVGQGHGGSGGSGDGGSERWW